MPFDQTASVIRNKSKVDGAPSDVPFPLYSLGSTAIALTMGIQPTLTRLEGLKDQLRTGAHGNSYCFDIAGMGTISIDRPAPASTWFEYEVDEEKLNALSEAERTKLLKSGVISRKRKQRKESKAKITIDLNA